MGSFFHSLSARIAGFFGGHQKQIQTAVTIAKNAVTGTQVALTVAVAADPELGSNSSVKNLSGILSGASDGLDRVSAVVASEADATTLQMHMQNIGALAVGLATTTNDIGVKNAGLKQSIDDTVHHLTAVVGSLETAANAVPAPAAQ